MLKGNNGYVKKIILCLYSSIKLTEIYLYIKAVRCLKITDIFSVAIWKFYFKLMNNTMPNYFHLLFHLPVINHKFAEQSLKYCLSR